jgi:hypothetical protein
VAVQDFSWCLDWSVFLLNIIYNCHTLKYSKLAHKNNKYCYKIIYILRGKLDCLSDKNDFEKWKYLLDLFTIVFKMVVFYDDIWQNILLIVRLFVERRTFLCLNHFFFIVLEISLISYSGCIFHMGLLNIINIAFSLITCKFSVIVHY